MEISLEWLSDFVEVPPLDQLVEKLARAGVEVEQVRDPCAKVAGVVVAEIERCAPHPQAERLQLCTVFDGSERYEVVCGAPNCTAGLRVPFAPPGSKLPGGAVETRAVRGVASHGMLCSRAELGLAEKSEGLWELPEGAELGLDVFKAARVAPTITLSVTPNRPDLLSHVGVAREVAAASGKKMKLPSWRCTEKGPDVSSLARVVVDDPTGCRRYVARVVRNIQIGPSPAWLQARLEAAGMRAINNVVDVTNYILLELGQPLHAFDLSRLAAEAALPTLHVRRARPHEKLKLIDGTTLELDQDELVIADATDAVALAGVMGGSDSEVSDATTAVLLESAYFEPSRVRRSAKRHGLHTEASHRFERGADPGICQKAVDRCAQLLADIAGGEVAKGVLEVAQKSEPPREITLRLGRVPRILGVEMPAETVAQLLEPLEIRCTVRNEASLRFQAPTFRPDLTREIDLIEELARRYGYDRIPERMPNTEGPYVPFVPDDDSRASARAALLASGCSEVVTFGFGSPAEQVAAAPEAGEPLRITNPLGEELSAMRTTLLPGLLKVLSHNQRHGQKHLRIFEIGTTFAQRAPSPNLEERDRDLPNEELRVGVLVWGGRHAGRWFERGESVDFSDLAGVLENLVDAIDPATPFTRVAAARPSLSPHCAAALRFVGEHGATLGYAGQVHPSLLVHFEVEGPVYAAEVNLGLLAAAPRVSRYRELPRFPGTRRDVAVVAERKLEAETIRAFLAANAGGQLGPEVVEQVRLFDVYAGKPIPDTHVSLAFAIEYRSRERTLTDAEVSEAFNAVQDLLKTQFRVEVRSGS